MLAILCAILIRGSCFPNLLHRGVIGVLIGFTSTLSRYSCSPKKKSQSVSQSQQIKKYLYGKSRVWISAYLLAVLGVQENPSELNDLGRVLCNVYAVLVAGCCNVDNDISVEVPLLGSRQSYRHRIWLYFCLGRKGCRVSNL